MDHGVLDGATEFCIIRVFTGTFLVVFLRVEQTTETSSTGGGGSILLSEHIELAQTPNKLHNQLEVSFGGI